MLSESGNYTYTFKTMDDVLASLEATSINPVEEQNNTTNFEGLYKNWGKFGHQEKRRKELLEDQRQDRNHTLDACRGILELVKKQEHGSQNHEVHYRPSIYVAGFTRTSTNYRDVLMMSEWMVEKPQAFHEDWYVVPCPRGVRTLLVASQGITKCYNKYGHYRMSCRTALPGGNPCDPKKREQCVVLDCFHVEALNTMFVLDLLAWNNQPMGDGETEFRYYWLKTHIEDIPELKTLNHKNKMLFEVLPKIDCEQESFNNFMMTYPYFKGKVLSLDGLLFYHKMAHYVSGETPLVGWLYPFMVNEVLGSDITVSPAYLLEKPIDYVGQASFIQNFQSKKTKKMSVIENGEKFFGVEEGEFTRKKLQKHKLVNDEEMADEN